MSEDQESHPLKVAQIKELKKQRISELERADIIRRGRPTPQLALSQESTKNVSEKQNDEFELGQH